MLKVLLHAVAVEHVMPAAAQPDHLVVRFEINHAKNALNFVATALFLLLVLGPGLLRGVLELIDEVAGSTVASSLLAVHANQDHRYAGELDVGQKLQVGDQPVNNKLRSRAQGLPAGVELRVDREVEGGQNVRRNVEEDDAEPGHPVHDDYLVSRHLGLSLPYFIRHDPGLPVRKTSHYEDEEAQKGGTDEPRDQPDLLGEKLVVARFVWEPLEVQVRLKRIQ